MQNFFNNTIRRKSMAASIEFPRFRWFVLAALCISTIATTIEMIAPATVMGIIAKGFGTDLGTTTGTIMGLFPLAVGVSCLIGGALIDRFGFIKVAIVCLILLIASSLLVPVLGKDLGGIALLRILQGIASGPILVIISPAAALWFPRKERAIVSGLQGASVSIGLALGFAIAPAIFQAVSGWQVMMAWLSIVGIIGLILVLIVFAGPKPPVARITGNGSESLSDFKLALRQPVTWVGVLIFICGSWLLQAFNDLTPAYLAIDPPVGVGFGPMKSGQIMSIYMLAYLLCAGLSGFVMNKVFKNNARPVIFIGFVFAGIFCTSIILPFVFSNLPILVICLLLAGVGAFTMPCAVAFITLCYPPYITGKIEGMWQGIGIFGGAIGVFAGAAALRGTGNYHMSIFIITIIAVVGLIISLFMNPSRAFCVNEEGRVVRAPDTK
jgi:MFS family permease